MQQEVHRKISELKAEQRPVVRLVEDLKAALGFSTGWHSARIAALQADSQGKLCELEELQTNRLIQVYLPDLQELSQQAALSEIEPETLRNVVEDLGKLIEVSELEEQGLRTLESITTLHSKLAEMVERAQLVRLDLSAWEYVLSDHLLGHAVATQPGQD